MDRIPPLTSKSDEHIEWKRVVSRKTTGRYASNQPVGYASNKTCRLQNRVCPEENETRHKFLLAAVLGGEAGRQLKEGIEMSEVSAVGTQKTIDQIVAANEKNKIGKRNTGELGKDDFLQLLITQLQHQDPMNPSSDQDFIAQIAQFSSLEQMKNMSTSMSYQQGFSMMGKFVSAVITDDVTGSSRTVSGQVSAVKMVEGKVKLVIGEEEVDIDRIAQVSDDAQGIGGAVDINKYNNLIGLTGKFEMTDSNQKTTKVEGIISRIAKTDAGAMATLDEVSLTPTLDKGAFESIEAYLEAMTGKSVSFRVKDAVTGADLMVSGTLREHTIKEDGTVSVIADGVQASVDKIVATRKVDLFSSDTLLLAQILEQLRKNQGISTEESSDGNTTEPVTEVVE